MVSVLRQKREKNQENMLKRNVKMEYSVVPDQDSLPPDPQYEWQQQLADLPQQLQDQIDEHIEALEEEVIAYDPFDLIGSLFCKNALTDAALNDVQEDRNDVFTEYLTLLLLTRPSEAYPERSNNELPLDILSRIEDYIQNIFRDFTLSIMFRNAGAQVSQIEPSDPWERLRGQMIMRSIMVRYPIYHQHFREVLFGLFAPLDRELTALVGFTIGEALNLIDAVSSLMIERLDGRLQEAKRNSKELLKQAELYRRQKLRRQKQRQHIEQESEQVQTIRRLASLRPQDAARALQTMKLHWIQRAAGRTFSFTPEDLEQRTQLSPDCVRAFLERMSLRFGEVEPTYFRRPAPLHPLMRRPFIERNGRYLCPVLPQAYRSLRPALETFLNPGLPSAVNTNRSLWERYNKRLRANYIEERAITYLCHALRHAHGHRGLTYYIGTQQQQVELDGMVIADSTLFLVEAKAGSLSPGGQRGAPQSLRTDLRRIVGEASAQLRRAAEYIHMSDYPSFTLHDGTEITVPMRQIHHIFLVSVTLDSFDALVTNLAQYTETGLFSPDALPWAVSLTDLRVISEMVEYSSQFVHYLLRRQKINEIKGAQIQAFEELDLFGNYLKEGLYFEDVMAESDAPDLLQLADYASLFDAYYLALDSQSSQEPSRPIQSIPPLLRDILRELEDQHPQRYLDAGCALLDLSGHARASLIETIETQRQRTLIDGGFHDFSTPIEAAGTGITCMFAPREHALELHERLVNHCLHKMGDHSSKLWIGFGFLVDTPRQLNSCLVFESNRGKEEDGDT